MQGGERAAKMKILAGLAWPFRYAYTLQGPLRKWIGEARAELRSSYSACSSCPPLALCRVASPWQVFSPIRHPPRARVKSTFCQAQLRGHHLGGASVIWQPERLPWSSAAAGFAGTVERPWSPRHAPCDELFTSLRLPLHTDLLKESDCILVIS